MNPLMSVGPFSLAQEKCLPLDIASQKPTANHFVEELLLIPVALGALATLGTVLAAAVLLKLTVTVVVLPSIVFGAVVLTATAVIVSVAAGAMAAFGAAFMAATSLAGFAATALAGTAFAGICLVVAPVVGLIGAVLATVIRTENSDYSDEPPSRWQVHVGNSNKQNKTTNGVPVSNMGKQIVKLLFLFGIPAYMLLAIHKQ